MADLLIDQLRMMAESFPDETAYAVVPDGGQLTFAEWEQESDRLARGLLASGVEKGDRVAVYLPPERALSWITAYAAVHKAGAVAVPTNTRLAARELEYVLSHSGVVAAFTAGATAETLAGVRPALPALRWAVAAGDQVPSGFVPWNQAGSSGPPPRVPLDGDDMADIMYTSGTTGRPKGVVVRHRNAAMMPNGRPNWSGDGWLHASPLFTFAGIASVFNPMKLGMTGVYQPRFDAAEWLDVVEKRRPAAVFLVPAMAQLLLAHPRFDEADLGSILMASIGSAPLAPETMRRLQAKLPQAWVSNNWGMTEAGSAFCSLPPEEAPRRVGSVGKPVPPVTFRIVDDDGVEQPARSVGELLVSNPGKEREYFADPEATAETWRDGWLHTGDLALLDEDGYLYIVGRKKDVIIRGGNNVHAADVEAALLEHPAVLEAAVAGVPHAVLGEDVAAWVVAAPGPAPDVDALTTFLRERLSDYKVPRRVTFVDELPRNATGKVMKHLLARD
ncbi:MAG TPA: class I adenylate-forming enzyme family protein [Acidimicrobiales bacterium]|nr:class I adenylate-forming enzyme family protein [Acidimicrobiales bacterium]